MNEREAYETYVVRPLTLVVDNDRELYEGVTEAARTAAAEDMGSPAPDMEAYRTLYRNRDREVVGVVGLAVAYYLTDALDRADMPEVWRSVLLDVLDLHTWTVRGLLGEHYMPEPDDMAGLLAGGDEDEDEEDA